MLRPLTETDVSSTVSGSFLRGLCREEAILPKALLPAFTTALPVTETSWASLPSQVLPTGVFEVKELTALTVIVVPVGSVAAFTDEAATQAQTTEITAMTFACFVRVVNCVSTGCLVRRLVCRDRSGLHRRIDQLEDHGRDRASGEVCQ